MARFALILELGLLLVFGAIIMLYTAPAAHAQQWHQQRQQRGPVIHHNYYPPEYGRRFNPHPYGYQQFGWRPPPPMRYGPRYSTHCRFVGTDAWGRLITHCWR